MFGNDLRLLIIMNDVRPKDIARVMGVSQATITRLCRPNRELALYELNGVVDAIKMLTGRPLVNSVDLEPMIAGLMFRYNGCGIPAYYNNNGMGYNS